MANDFKDIKDVVAKDPERISMTGMQPSILSKEEIPAPEEAPMLSEPEMPEEIPSTPLVPTTISPMFKQQPGRELQEQIEEITESVVNEKWEELMANVGNIAIWREKINTDVRSIKQELVRVEERFENLQKAVLGRVEEYHKTMTDVGSEMKALERVLERILQPLASNIKELSRITEDLKKHR